MSTAPLLCLCLVVAAAAANDCVAGDASCNAEQDASALLQSAVSFGSGQLVEEASTASSSSCSSSSCSGVVESACDRSACSWAGEQCKPKCLCINDKSTCVSSGYCEWEGNNANTGTCIEDLAKIDLGGSDSAMHYQAGAPVAQRPELLLKDHYDGSTWTPCNGNTDCFYGASGGSWRYDDMKVKLTQKTKAGIQFTVKCTLDPKDCCKTTPNTCDSDGDVGKGMLDHCPHIRVTYTEANRDDAGVEVWYNETKLMTSSSTWSNQRRRAGPSWNRFKELLIPISSTDAEPLFRMEVSKLNTRRRRKQAKLEVKIEVNNIKAWFDACMEKKQAHSQCRQVFADGDEALANDHAKMLACLDGSNPNIASCDAWKTCLAGTADGAGTMATLKNVIEASGVTLLQQNTVTQSNWPDGTCSVGPYPMCEDLSRLDIPAFSCTCYLDLQNADGTPKSPDEIKALACPKRAMCCSWKQINCQDWEDYTLTGAMVTPTLLQVADEEDSTKTMSNRSKQASLAQETSLDDSVSLDESLSGKRC